MNHISIGIIRKKSTTQASQFDYLVLSEDGQFKFFETINIAIGGTFDFSSFRKQIIEYFKLPEKVEMNGTDVPVDFENPPTLFKSSKRDPEATAYLYELSQPQVESINQGIDANKQEWAHIKWVEEGDLKSKHPWTSTQLFLFEKETAFNPPKFSNDFRASLKKIVTAKENGKLVIFAGAGISLDSHVPGWGSLINELKNDLTTTETDFLELAELYYQSRGEKEYHEKIQEILKYGKTKYNPVHRKIMDLNPIHIVTTNYDTHFEQLLENKGLPYSIIRADSDFPYSKGSSLFVKMHGDFGLRNIVLRKTDYDTYKDRFSLIQSFIRETFASKLVLFVGFSFDDKNLKYILDSVEKILKKDIQQPYLFNILDSSKGVSEMKRNLQEKGVRLLQFQPALDDYFDQIKNAEDDDSLKLLSIKSQGVYKFLKVIEEFDLVSDSLENHGIKNQFIHSLERFNDLGAIPLEILCSITPFKLKKHPKNQSKVKAEFNYHDPFHLETLNEELLTFLHSRKNEKGEIDFYTYKDTNLGIDEQNINRYLKLLYTSGVHCIRRKSDTESKHLKLNPINKNNDQCNCVRCLYDRFELKKLIYSLNSLSAKGICKSDFYDEGLLEAYGFLKTGQIIKAFYALEAVRRESIKSEQYITYFIACYNEKLLPPILLIFYESNYNEGEVDRIVERIEALDLDKILNDLPAARDIKQCLRLIMENNIYKNMYSKMEEEFETIKQTHLSYKRNGYWSSGPNYWNRVQSYFYLVWNFYHKNLLFTDENYSFSKMAYIYLESMVASHMTHDRYSQKLKDLPHFFCQIFVQYGYANDTTELFKQYSVSILKLTDGVKSVVDEFVVFLDSGYDKSNFLGEKISRESAYHSIIDNSSYFRKRVTRTFNNFLVLLIHLKVEKSDANLIVEKMIYFLSVSEIFSTSDSHKYFSKFINNNIEVLDQEQIQRIGFYVLSNNIWSSSLIPSFCNALISTIKLEKIFDADFYVTLSRRIEEKREWPLAAIETIPFYVLLKGEQQQKLSELMESSLKEEESKRWDIIVKAYTWKMWNPQTNKEIFDPFFEHVVKQSLNFPEYLITNEGQPEGKNFQPWNDLYLTISMIYSYDLFDLPFVGKLYENLRPNMFKWILKPKEFDYSVFEVKWLLVFSRSEFIQKLKGNSSLSEVVHKRLIEKYDSKVAELFYKKLSG